MAYLYCIAASALLVASLGMLVRRWHVLRSGARATGRVVSHVARERDDGTSFHAVFAFTDHSGHEHHIASNAGWSAPRPPVGTAVSVRYARSQPHRAYIDNFYHLWFWPLALSALAATLALAGWLST